MNTLTVSKSDITRVLDAMNLPWTCIGEADNLVLDIPSQRQNEFFFVTNQVLGEDFAWKLVCKRRVIKSEKHLMNFPTVHLDQSA